MCQEKVSVIIPVYNRVNTIKRSIDSVLCQTYDNFELIIVDDGSTDNIYKIISSYKDSRVRYFRTAKRYGANHARNLGIQNAEGEYIAFQDSDDLWLKDKLEKQMDIFKKNSQIDVVWCRYRRFTSSGMCQIVPENYGFDKLQKGIEKILTNGNVIGTPTMIVRKKCFEKAGTFDEEIQRFQDWEFCIRFSQKFRFYFIDETLVEAYESEQSITNTNSAMESQFLILRKHQDFFEKAGNLEIQIGRLIELAVDEKKLEDLSKYLDERLFLKGVYSCVEKSISMKKNYFFIKEWMQKDNIEMLINSYFAEFPEKSIGIYGMGEIGRLLLNTMSKNSKKKVAFVIDRNVDIVSEYEIITLEQLKDIDGKSIECIIITAIAYEAEIRKNIKQVTTLPVVSLYDVIRGKC